MVELTGSAQELKQRTELNESPARKQEQPATNTIDELRSDPQIQAKRDAVRAVEASLPRPPEKQAEARAGKPEVPPNLLENTLESAEKYNETMIAKLTKNLMETGDPKAIELAKKLNEDWANRDQLEKDFEKKHPGMGMFFPGKGRLCCCKTDADKASNYRFWLGTSEHTASAQCHGTNLARYFPPRS